MRSECGDQHEIAVQVRGDDVGARGDAGRAETFEGAQGVAEEAQCLQHRKHHDRFVDVELEIALRAGESNRGVETENRDAHLGEGLRLGRIHLAGHNRGTRLVIGDRDFADAGAGAGSIPANIVRDLHGGDGQGAQARRKRHEVIVGGQGCGEIIGRTERQTGRLLEQLTDPRRETRMRIQAGAHRGPAQRHPVQARRGCPHPRERALELRRPRTHHLIPADRGSVLQMGAPHHHHLRELARASAERGRQALHRRDEVAVRLASHRHIHRGGKHIIRRLAFIDVVIGVYRCFPAALAGGDLICARGNHLISVHIRLGARTGLEHLEREFRVEHPFGHLAGRRGNESGELRIEHPELGIRAGRSTFEQPKGVDEGAAPGVAIPTDGEMLERASGLRAPIVLGGHLDRAHRIRFRAGELILCHDSKGSACYVRAACACAARTVLARQAKVASLTLAVFGQESRPRAGREDLRALCLLGKVRRGRRRVMATERRRGSRALDTPARGKRASAPEPSPTTEKAALREERDRLHAECENLRTENTQLNAENSQLRREHEGARSEAATLQARITELEGLVADLRRREKELEAGVVYASGVEQSAVTAQARSEDAMRRAARLVARVRGLEQQVEEERRRYAALEAAGRAREARLTVDSARTSAAHEERYTSQISTLEVQLREARAQLAAIRTQLETSEDELAEAQAELSEAQSHAQTQRYLSLGMGGVAAALGIALLIILL